VGAPVLGDCVGPDAAGIFFRGEKQLSATDLSSIFLKFLNESLLQEVTLQAVY
jgi:hypothetical protein